MLRSIGDGISPNSTEPHTLQWVLEQTVVDYLAYQVMYTTATGKRAMGLIVLSGSGTIVARRVTATRVRETQKLRNWMEAYVWFDLPLDSDPVWMRDLDEEELWRDADRMALDAMEGKLDDDK